jgi:phage terminase small subunit
MLAPNQKRFVEEYLVDLNGKRAAIRAGYSSRSAEVQGSRLLRNDKVKKALESAMKARSRRTKVTADRVVAELAKIAFANMCDYWSRSGETLDLSRIDQDRMAAVEEIAVDETINSSGVLYRRTRVKLRDKVGALASLARHLGMAADRHAVEGSVEQRVLRMSPEERQACAAQPLAKAHKHLPAFQECETKQSQEG